MKKPIEAAAALTDEWFALRPTIIGSSEAAKAVGLSEYGTPLQLFLEKTGQTEPFAGNEHTRRGRRYEPLIAEDWQELTGRKLRRYPCPMFLHPEFQGVAATPDGEIDDQEGLEIKSTTFRMRNKLGEQLSDDVPNDWLLQAQQQMAVMGWRVVHFCILVDLQPCMYKVDRNDDLIAMMISAELELLERIKNNDPPEPTWAHASTPRLIREMHKTSNDVRVMLSDAAAEAWAEQERLGKEISAREKLRAELKARTEFEIGENFAGVLPDGRMVRRKLITKAEYRVTPKPYWDIRAVQFDGGVIAEHESETTFPPTESELYAVAEAVLEDHGYLLKEESDHGSRYYCAIGKPDVRVSNHAPNSKTRNWMDRNGVISIRTDLQEFAEQLQQVETRFGAETAA